MLFHFFTTTDQVLGQAVQIPRSVSLSPSRMASSTFYEFTQLGQDEQYNFTGGHALEEGAATPDNNGTQTSCPTAVRRSRRTIPLRRPTTGKQIQQSLPKLQFLQLDEWDENNTYDEDEPTCLHYAIEWKVCVNDKVVSRDIERDLVLLPTAYWHMSLKPKLE
jgi:hypothetical protein